MKKILNCAGKVNRTLHEQILEAYEFLKDMADKTSHLEAGDFSEHIDPYRFPLPEINIEENSDGSKRLVVSADKKKEEEILDKRFSYVHNGKKIYCGENECDSNSARSPMRKAMMSMADPDPAGECISWKQLELELLDDIGVESIVIPKNMAQALRKKNDSNKKKKVWSKK